MASGLQVWDASGNMVVDSNSFLGRIVGSISTNFTNGSISADLSKGTPFAFPVVIQSPSSSPSLGTPGGALRNPTITTSSSGVSWVFPSGYSGSVYVNCIIYYGVY